MSDHGMGAFAGLLISAWLFYMVFDAWSTAKARRYGMPIPDPLGLNADSGRARWHLPAAGGAGRRTPGIASGIRGAEHRSAVAEGWRSNAGRAPLRIRLRVRLRILHPVKRRRVPLRAQNKMRLLPPPGAGAAPSPGSGRALTLRDPMPGRRARHMWPPGKEHEHSPVGAVVLIGLGMLFLLANLGWFSFHWISHSWPADSDCAWFVVVHSTPARRAIREACDGILPTESCMQLWPVQHARPDGPGGSDYTGPAVPAVEHIALAF